MTKGGKFTGFNTTNNAAGELFVKVNPNLI